MERRTVKALYVGFVSCAWGTGELIALLCLVDAKAQGEGEKEALIPTASAEPMSEGVKENTAGQGVKESSPDSKATLSSEEKMKLLSLYDCESDEDEYHASSRCKGATENIGGLYGTMLGGTFQVPWGTSSCPLQCPLYKRFHCT